MVWRAPLPPGHSSPVSARRIFLTGFEGNQLFTICLDRRTGGSSGGARSRARARTAAEAEQPGLCPRPVTDGENVYVFFQDFGLLPTGRTGRSSGGCRSGRSTVLRHGGSPSSPEDRVILACDQDTNSFCSRPTRGRARPLAGRPARGHLGLLDADASYRLRGGPVHSCSYPSPSRSRPTRWRRASGSVAARAGLRDEVGARLRRQDALHQRWAAREPPGKQVAVAPSPRPCRGSTRTRTGRSPRPRCPRGSSSRTFISHKFDLDRDGVLDGA